MATNPAALHYELLRDFTALGKELGLKDSDLNKFVQEQVKIAQERANAERDERMQARDAEMKRLELQREYEQQCRIAEQDERQRERDAEAKRLEAEREAAQQAYEHELAKLRLQHELELSKHSSTSISHHSSDDEGHEQASSSGTKRGPRMPFFDEAKDDIDAYLYRFERVAELSAYRQDDYALYLSALLRGKALECYNRLGAADARNYIKLRSALLHKFGKTEEGYRKQFISCKRDSDETAAQFIVRLLGYFDRWLELAKVDETFEALRTFIARDRFLDSSEEKLALYLRERKFATLDELVTAADNYLEAHRSSAVSGPTKDKSKSYNAPQQQNMKPAASVDKQTSAHTPDTNKRTNDDRVCYN